MKRRTSRRQVLNLNDNQDSPSHSWQTKYQQICAEHLSHHNRNTASKMSAQNSSALESNPLTNLVGHYNSDSDSEGGGDREPTDKIDSQVSDFLKEIKDIKNTTESTEDSSAKLAMHTDTTTNEGTLKPQPPLPPVPTYQATDGQSQAKHPGMSWQECYDESSGYVYYWNMETNAVTWEMPAEYHAYVSASYDAQQWMYHQHAMYQQSLQQMDMSSYMMAGYGYNMDVNSEGNAVQEEEQEETEEPVERKFRGKHKNRKRKNVEEDDERIEMITSYGPATDEESDDDDDDNEEDKEQERKKVEKKRLKTRGNVIGPKTHTPSFSNNVDDSVPPGMENIDEEIVCKKQLGKCPNKTIASDSENVVNIRTSEMNGDVKKKPTVSNVDSFSKKIDSDNNQGVNSFISSPGNVNSGVSSPAVQQATTENDGDCTETDENLILSQLKNRAKLLKELGGEIPDEVKSLIDTSLDSASPAAQNVSEQEMDSNRKQEPVKEDGSSSPAPASFALIASYGDDSDTEEKSMNESQLRKSKSPKTPKEKADPSKNQVSKTVFPISSNTAVENSVSSTVNCLDNTSNSDNVNSVKMAKPKVSHSENISENLSSTTTVKVDPDVLTSKGQGKKTVAENSTSTSYESSISTDSPSANKVFQRKKRLEISNSAYSTTESNSNSASTKSVVPSTSSGPSSTSSTSYTTFTHYNLDPASDERRGFGFQNDLGKDSINLFNLDQSEGEKESKKTVKSQKKGMINFVKAETINLQPEEKNKCESDNIEQASARECNTKEDIQHLADTIIEKLKFLSEVQQPVSTVQVMAIEVETLMSAWHAGALIQTYLGKWLNEKSEELIGLEQTGAPYGWACQWDRTYKRYYYANLESGETQWEYPSEETGDKTEEMDLCTTPPPTLVSAEPPPQPAEPPMPIDEPPPPPPPPPHISLSIPSPPRPPRISESSEKAKSPVPKKKRKLSKGSGAADAEQNSGNILSSGDDLPPLPASSPPPLPPPPDDPPPLPPSPPQAPSPSRGSTSQRKLREEPLPPGVDAPEVPYIVSKPLPPHLAAYQQHPLQPTSAESVEYDQAAAAAAMYADAQHYLTDGSYQHMGMTPMGLEYGPITYIAPVSSSHTIERPATKNKASLYDELDSFYSDLASMESAGMISPPPATVSERESDTPEPTKEEEIATIIEPQRIENQSTVLPTEIEPDPQTKNAEAAAAAPDARKKKKTKLVPALGLKKKGVPTLVAKWQQVQQEVRRDYKNLDEEDESSN